MRVSGTGMSGLRASVARMDAAASSIARASAITVDPVAATQPVHAGAGVSVRLTAPSPGRDDPGDALVDLAEAELLYRANAKVVSAGDRMIGTLLDIRG